MPPFDELTAGEKRARGIRVAGQGFMPALSNAGSLLRDADRSADYDPYSQVDTAGKMKKYMVPKVLGTVAADSSIDVNAPNPMNPQGPSFAMLEGLRQMAKGTGADASKAAKYLQGVRMPWTQG